MYNFKFKLLDTRCNLNTLWANPTNHCILITEIGKSICKNKIVHYKKMFTDYHPKIEFKETYNTSSYYNDEIYLYIVFPFIFIIGGFVLLLLSKRKNSKPKGYSNCIEMQITDKNTTYCTSILLIYARDSDQFVEIINKFKNLLNSMEEIKVNIVAFMNLILKIIFIDN